MRAVADMGDGARSRCRRHSGRRVARARRLASRRVEYRFGATADRSCRRNLLARPGDRAPRDACSHRACVLGCASAVSDRAAPGVTQLCQEMASIPGGRDAAPLR